MSTDFLYNTTADRGVFGRNWCGPARLEYAQPTLVAKMPRQSEDSYDVEVYCRAMPARAYEIRATPPRGPSGPSAAFSMTTGSGSEMARLVVAMAHALAQNNLALGDWAVSAKAD